MAFDMLMKITDQVGQIKGETKISGFPDQIDVLAWSWGQSQSGSFQTGGGGGAGKVNVQDLSFTKWVDASSPALLLSCSTGSHLKEAVLTVRKSGGKTGKDAVNYLVITMKKGMITSISTGGSGGEDRLTENVTINFAEVYVVYTPQDDAGAGGTALNYHWNIEANEGGATAPA